MENSHLDSKIRFEDGGLVLLSKKNILYCFEWLLYMSNLYYEDVMFKLLMDL